MKIYQIHSYDSFCETESILYSYLDYQKAKNKLDDLLEDKKNAIIRHEKCVGCPVHGDPEAEDISTRDILDYCQDADLEIFEDYYTCKNDATDWHAEDCNYCIEKENVIE